MNGFFVTGIQEGTFSSVRLKLSETRAFPKNAGITVEYQLIATKGMWVPIVGLRFDFAPLPSRQMQCRLLVQNLKYYV